MKSQNIAMTFPPPFTPEEEEYYYSPVNFARYKQTIIEHNLRLVTYVINKFIDIPQGVDDMDDYVSIGCIGLVRAVNGYNHENGVKFATYASKVIHNEILIYFRKIKTNKNKALYTADSLDRVVHKSDTGSYLTLGETLQDPKADMLEELMSKDSRTLYSELISKQPIKVQECIKYFSLGKPQREIAKLVGMSQPEVSRTIRKAVAKIKSIVDIKEGVV